MKNRIIAWLILSCIIQSHNATAQPAPPAAGPRIIFLLLKMTKDSLTGVDSLRLVEKIGSPGLIKRTPPAVPALTRLPYLSLRFYKGKTALDSTRYGYPLRERIQNTRENAQGYKDIEIRSIEFFFRFQLGEADRLEIYKISNSGKQKLLAIDLQ